MTLLIAYVMRMLVRALCCRTLYKIPANTRQQSSKSSLGVPKMADQQWHRGTKWQVKPKPRIVLVVDMCIITGQCLNQTLLLNFTGVVQPDYPGVVQPDYPETE